MNINTSGPSPLPEIDPNKSQLHLTKPEEDIKPKEENQAAKEIRLLKVFAKSKLAQKAIMHAEKARKHQIEPNQHFKDLTRYAEQGMKGEAPKLKEFEEVEQKELEPKKTEDSEGLIEAKQKIKLLAKDLSKNIKPEASNLRTREEPILGSQPKFQTPASRSIEAPENRVNIALSEQADFKTKQGERADEVAAKTQACIMSSVAHADGVFVATLFPVGKSPPEQFQAMVNSLKGVMDDAKLDNADDCKLVTFLAGLMNKGWNEGVGKFTEGWKNEWSNLGSSTPLKWTVATDLTWGDVGFSLEEMIRITGKNDLTQKEVQTVKLTGTDLKEMGPDFHERINRKLEEKHVGELANNIKLKEKFGEMVIFLNDNYKNHFDLTKRHPAGVEVTLIQLQAILGQLIHDVVLDRKMLSGGLLKKHMIQTGLIHESSFDDLAKIEKAMRNNPLLAEAPNSQIKSDIISALEDVNNLTGNNFLSFIKDHLNKAIKKNNLELDSNTIDRLAGQIVEKYLNEINQLKTFSYLSGERGRMPSALKVVAEEGKYLAGARGESNSFAVMPNRSDDAAVFEWAAKTIDSEQTRAFMAATQGKNSILSHGGSPTNLLRLGTGLDVAFREFFAHPEKLMQSAIDSMISEDPGNVNTALLTAFSVSLNKERAQAKLKRIIGDIDITFNAATKQKIHLKKMAHKKTVASIMFKNDLRTICSVSGTTVDGILGMTLSLGKEKMQQILQPLTDYTEKFINPSVQATLDNPEGYALRKIITGISFFMQTGQYHTAAEVLGGLFIAARGLTQNEEDNINITDTIKMFDGLMEEFSKAPENFIEVSKEDARKINEGYADFKNTLREQHLQRIARTKERVRNQ